MAFGETILADEAERFRGYAEEIAVIQRARAEKTGKTERALHVKQHLGAVGTLTVQADVPVQAGVFATKGKVWPLYARFSNGSSKRQSDRVLDPRGFAIKLVGVPGTKLIRGLEGEETQDFLFIQTPEIAFSTPEEFMKFVRIAKAGTDKLLPRLAASFGWKRTLEVVWHTATSKKLKSFATHTFHTAAPVAFGKTAAKLALVPALHAPQAKSSEGDDMFRADLSARLREGPLSWTLRAQLFVDQQRTPIEDTSQPWRGPWHDLGTLTLAQQDAESARGQEISELVNQLSFDPWHATEQHRPLGAIMRARAVTYGKSVVGRGAAPEPKSVLSV